MDTPTIRRFEVIQRDPTLAERVIGEIERLVIDRQLEAGERLPPERELAQQFGVSRTVIREATRTLAARGLVATGPAGGMVIRAASPTPVAEALTLLLRRHDAGLEPAAVMEVRRILEGSIAGLAAERRTEADIERLEAVLGEARDHVEDLGAFIRSDLAFHAALAAASHNELFLLILQSLGTVLREVRELGSRIPGTPERALSHHQRILDAVRSRDPEAARAAMDIHMDEAQATLTSAVDTPRGPA